MFVCGLKTLKKDKLNRRARAPGLSQASTFNSTRVPVHCSATSCISLDRHEVGAHVSTEHVAPLLHYPLTLAFAHGSVHDAYAIQGSVMMR